MATTIELKVSVGDIEPMREIINILVRHSDDLPEDLRIKLMGVLERYNLGGDE